MLVNIIYIVICEVIYNMCEVKYKGKNSFLIYTLVFMRKLFNSMTQWLIVEYNMKY